MKNYFLVCFASFFAATAPPIWAESPKQCPSVQAIKNAQFSPEVLQIESHQFDVYQPDDYYNTEKSWGFRIDAIHAQTREEAIQIAKKDMLSLNFLRGPLAQGRLRDRWWSCEYITSSGNMGIAITDN
jgi:hypothetical protein